MNTLSAEEQLLLRCPCIRKETPTKSWTPNQKKYQKLNTLRICGNSFVSTSESFLLFILLLIFLHSKLHGVHALDDLFKSILDINFFFSFTVLFPTSSCHYF